MTTKNFLETALKASEPIVQEYIRQLKAQITKLHKQIVTLEIEKMKFKNQNITYKQRVSALQKNLDKAVSNGGIHMELAPFDSRITEIHAILNGGIPLAQQIERIRQIVRCVSSEIKVKE
ncbi:MAG: hypothetical protein AB1401_03545 [Thermodesulfobacteriota bacterium]